MISIRMHNLSNLEPKEDLTMSNGMFFMDSYFYSSYILPMDILLQEEDSALDLANEAIMSAPLPFAGPSNDPGTSYRSPKKRSRDIVENLSSSED